MQIAQMRQTTGMTGSWSAIFKGMLLCGFVALPLSVSATTDAARAFDIPAGSLADALDRYSEQGGAQLLYAPDLVEGKQAPALSGDYTPAAALQVLLGDSGLAQETVTDDAVILKRNAAAAPEAAAEAATPAAVAPAPIASSIEEVIVTARRKEEKQQEVPLAITALSGDFLEKNAVVQLSDLNSYVPALHIDNFNSPTTTNIGIRAVRSTDIAPGQDSAVGVYMAEFNYGYTVGISQLMFDMQSVEVLKGPQGTLFGRNTTGGAMLFTPTRPDTETGYSANIGTSFFEGRHGVNAGAVFNVGVSDTLQLRAGFNVIDRDGYVRNAASRTNTTDYQTVPSVGMTDFEPLNDDRSGGWRLAALWTPTEQLESYTLYQGARVNTNGIGYSINALNPAGYVNAVFNGVTQPSAQDAYDRVRALQDADFWSTESNINTFSRLQMHVLSNATTWQFSDRVALKNVVGYRYFKRDDSIDFDGLPLQILEVRHPDTGREFSEELQLQGSTENGLFDWVAGLYYAQQSIERRTSQIVLGGPLAQTPVDADNRSYAAFVQGTWRLPVDGLSATAGLRYTRDEREQENRRYYDISGACFLSAGGVTLPDDNCVFRGKTSYEEPTYSLSLDYKLDRDTMLYFANRRGYRSGGFDYAAQTLETFGPFAPEFVTDFEIGLKKDWRFGDSLLRSNLAAYTQEYKDIQRFVSRPGIPGVGVINAATARINGGEMELTLIPFDGLAITGFYALTFAEYRDFVTGEGDFTDNEFAQVPREQFSLAFDYKLPLDADLGDVNLRADWYHQTHIFYADTAQGPDYGNHDSQGQAAYSMVNLSLNWSSVARSNVDLSLYVRNLTNEEVKPFGVLMYRSLGYNLSTIGEPRVIGLGLSYRFNI